MSKFKVGDKVKVINAGNAYALYRRMAEKLIDLAKGKAYQWEYSFGQANWIEMNGMIGEIVSSYDEHVLINLNFNGIKRSIIFYNSESVLLLVKEEFTFEEVIARIKEGEIYRCDNICYRFKEVSKVGGELIFTTSVSSRGRVSVDKIAKFKLVPQKKKYNLYEVEHHEGGKRFVFRSKLDHEIGDIVVCDTCKGKSYGKMVKFTHEELTEEEYKQYKPILKIISEGCPY